MRFLGVAETMARFVQSRGFFVSGSPDIIMTQPANILSACDIGSGVSRIEDGRQELDDKIFDGWSPFQPWASYIDDSTPLA